MKAKLMMILISMMVLVSMTSSVEGSFVLAENETLINDFLVVIAPGGQKMYNLSGNGRIFERGLRMYGEMRLDHNVHFFISNTTEYLDWQATNDTFGLLYDFPRVGELDIFYRHDITTDLVLVMYNENDEYCEGEIFLEIDRTGPNITHDIDEEHFYEGAFEIDFWVNDTWFRVMNASLWILGEMRWELSYDEYTAEPLIHGSYVLDTLDNEFTDFEDRYLTVTLKGADEAGNVASMNVKVYIDNFAAGTIPHGGGEFNFFSAVVFVGLIAVIGAPLYVAKWGWDNRIKMTKQERVDKINREAKKKKIREKKAKQDSVDKWFDRRQKQKSKKRKKKYGKK